LSEVVILSPSALDPSPIVVAAASAFVFVLLLVGIIARRRRDPIGRALAAHNLALKALRDSALRATSTPAAGAPSQPPLTGTLVVTSTPKEDEQVVS
jgi:hypothetical protein